VASGVVWILDRELPAGSGPLERLLGRARTLNAAVLRDGFRAAGADDVRIDVSVDDTVFGARLRSLVRSAPASSGGIVLGAGSLPLATATDFIRLVDVAQSGERRALTNSRFSADVVALGQVGMLLDLPNLASDNALPRWLAEVAGIPVSVMAGRQRLAFDLDSPLDLILLDPEGGRSTVWREMTALADDPVLELAQRRLGEVAGVASDRRAELLIAGRTSAAAVRWLECRVQARIRALIEERGIRASTSAAQASAPTRPRAAASTLGLLLERDGPDALGELVARLGDAALIDTRVLLAHRHGVDERAWPAAEDRFASDLLVDESIADPWLRALTRSARTARVPISLGGHTLVGPGVPFALARRTAAAARR
jgi:hypothetical protein